MSNFFRSRKGVVDGAFIDVVFLTSLTLSVKSGEPQYSGEMALKGYDNWIDTMDWLDNTPVTGQQFDYNFDSIGNRISAVSNGRTANYSPNNLNQYTQRDVPGAVDILGSATTDSTVTVNNQPTTRKNESFYKELNADNSTSAVYQSVDIVGVKNNVGPNGEDAVTEEKGTIFVPKNPEVFTCDTDGNLTQNGRWSMSWDAENRLTTAISLTSTPDGAKWKVEYVYDYQWRMIQRKEYSWNVSASTYDLASIIKFVYDGFKMIAELDGAGNLIHSYTYGIDLSGSMQGAGGVGGLLMMHDVASNSDHFYCHDGIGNVARLVNAANGQVSAEYEYSPTGQLIRSSGPMAKSNPFRFSSKYHDDKTGYINFGYRWYDPSTGRWLSRDPLNDLSFLVNYVQSHPLADVDELFEESLKPPYLFVGNDPTNVIDVNGLIEVAGGNLSNTAIHGVWESGPDPSVSDVSRTGFSGPKLNPGGNLGIGIVGINYKLTGTVKGKIRCSKECPLGKDFVKVLNEWHLNLTVNVNVSLTTGIGITQKYVNYGYNIPHKLIGVSKGIQKYSELQEILKAIAEDRLAPDALCNLHQKDLSLTLDVSLEK